MPVLKFSMKEQTLSLEKGVLVEITHDKRSDKLPKNSFLKNEFKVADRVYIAENSLIMKKAVKEDPTITALYFYHKECHVVIVAPRSYVFLDGRSIDVNKFSLLSFIVPSDAELGLSVS